MVAFLVAALGVALGFIAGHWSIRWLHVLAWLLTFASIVTGAVFLVRAAYSTMFGAAKSDAHDK